MGITIKNGRAPGNSPFDMVAHFIDRKKKSRKLLANFLPYELILEVDLIFEHNDELNNKTTSKHILKHQPHTLQLKKKASRDQLPSQGIRRPAPSARKRPRLLT